MFALLAPASVLSGIADWAADVIESLGYIGIIALVALESIIPPIPSEVILPLAGFLAGQGRFSLPLAIAAATLGSVIGAGALYGLSAWLGERRVYWVVERYGGYVRITTHDIDRANEWFDRYDSWAVAIGRLVPVIRSLVSIPAGLRRMPLGRFLLFTTVGSTVWNSVLIGLGWLLGDNWEEVEHYSSYIQYAILLAIAIAAVVFYYRRRTRAAPDVTSG
jgi:membrane protein DedA with SNARE-associated domain